MVKLQACPSRAFTELMAASLPDTGEDFKDIRAIYWLAVGNCVHPDPQPACLLLLPSMLYALVLPDARPDSMNIFHALPLSGLQEIEVGFGGQSIRLLGSVEGLVLTVFTYNKRLSQQLCRDLLCILASEPEAMACANHPLLLQDLVQLSLDWKAEVPGLVLASGVQLSSKFQATLVDMIYFLHGNMEADVPSLAEVQVLLYTTVRVEGVYSHVPCQSLVLLTTHIALVKEDRVFYPRPRSLSMLPPHTQFDVLRCRAVSELRCVVVPDKRNVFTVELVFSRKPELASDSRSIPSVPLQAGPGAQVLSTPLQLQGSQNQASEVWKLTFSSQDEALWLISHLTRL
ncbi:uncharacterized protein ACOB6Z_011811 [Ctenodactylus gundi]